MNQTQKAIEKPLECPISKKGRNSFISWVKKLGVAGFVFFLLKGLLWLIIPYLIAKGLIK